MWAISSLIANFLVGGDPLGHHSFEGVQILLTSP